MTYTLRTLRKTPMFTGAIVLTLTLGIGATTAIFSVVNAVILQPLPFAHADRLMWVAERNDKLNLPTFSASVLNYLSWKEDTSTFESLGAIGFSSFNLSGQGDPEQFSGGTLSPSVYPILGIVPVAGRAFQANEDRPGESDVAMISEGLWRRRFASDPSIVGRKLTLNGLDRTIVGVAPASIAVLSPGDIWVPLVIDVARERRLNHVITVIGRLKPGVTEATAQSAMDALAARVVAENPEIKNWGIRLVTFSRWIIGDRLRTSLLVLLGAVACVLLIACGNVANLLLGRAVSREREMALRTALGASRGRLFGQLLVESLVLSGAGGICGLVAASWAVRMMNVGLPQNLLPIPGVAIDASVLSFAAGVTVLTGVIFGLAPAWSAMKTDLNSVLKQTSRSSTGGSRTILRNGLAAAELALATMLLVGAGLLGQTLVRLQRVDLGFHADHLLTFQLSLPTNQYPLDTKAPVFYKDLIASLKSMPGVTSVAISSGVPFGQGNYTTSPFMTIGKSVVPPETSMPIDWRIVSPDFFQTLGVPLLRGRAFTDADGADGSAVILVSQSTAKRFWGDDDPIGRVIQRVADRRPQTVVGVVGDVRNAALNQETPVLYYPSAVRVWPRMDVVVKTAGEPASAIAAAREKVRALDRDVPLSTVRTMDEWVASSAAQPRLNALLLGVFAVVALIVAAVGVYGVIAYSVTQRTQEIGLRMALGAQRGGVVRLILREGMAVAVVGIGAGLGGALALGQALANLVYGVPVRDPATLAGVAAILAVVALTACALPARAASRVDPLVALRSE